LARNFEVTAHTDSDGSDTPEYQPVVPLQPLESQAPDMSSPETPAMVINETVVPDAIPVAVEHVDLSSDTFGNSEEPVYQPAGAVLPQQLESNDLDVISQVKQAVDGME
jgi:hypothetical protein